MSGFEIWEQAHEFRSTAEYPEAPLAPPPPPFSDVDEIEAFWARMLAAPVDKRKAKGTDAKPRKKPGR